MESVKYYNNKLLNNSPKNNIVYDDDLLNTTLNNMRLADKTQEQYKYVMLMFLKSVGISFNDLINTIEPKQHDMIEDNKIIKYDPNHSLLKDYYDKFINDCRNRGNKERSIQSNVQRINSILKKNGIITPKIKFDIPDSQKKIPVLTNKDIAFIIDNHCNIHQKAIISFMASSGIRRYDTLHFKIKDFLKATYKYHKTLDLDEFLNKYQKNMVGYWEFTPHKTKKSGLVCKVCNSGESSNYIVESFKERIRGIDKYNKKHDKNYKLDTDCALFSNKYNHYIGHITENGFTNVISDKKKFFEEYKIKSLQDDLENEKISITEYDKLINDIPVFKAHNLRHYFISVLGNYISNNNIRLIMEAHTSDISTDKYYLGESEELFNEKTIRESYNTVEKYLTFNNSFYIKENDNLKNDNEQLLNDYNNLKTENMKLNNILKEKNNQIENEIEGMKKALNIALNDMYNDKNFFD